MKCENLTHDAWKLIMLGTGNATVTRCYNTCFVISDGVHFFLTDAGGGNGILHQLEQAGICLENIHDVFVTHTHTDHLLGMVWIVRMVAQKILQGKYVGQLRIYGHDKVLRTLESVCQQTLPSKVVGRIGQDIFLKELTDGAEFDVFGMQMRCFDIGSTKEKQFGYRAVLPDGKVLVCLGDEPFNEQNRIHVANADWLLSEAFCLYEDRDRFRPYEKHHSTALDAGRLASQLGVKNLLLYHTEDKTLETRKKRYTAEAGREFDGPVYVPDDLEILYL